MPDDPSETTDLEGGRRLRAAFAYAGLSKAQRAAALGVGERQVSRYESGETTVPQQRLPAVVEATRVPSWFFEMGFEVAPEPEVPSVIERVEALEHRLDALADATRADALDLLRAALGDLYPEPQPSIEEEPSLGAGQDPPTAAGGRGGA